MMFSLWLGIILLYVYNIMKSNDLDNNIFNVDVV